MYYNQTCSSECPNPHEEVTIASQNLCLTPCSESENYFYWDGICEEECAYPYSSQEHGDSHYFSCHYPCSDNEFLFLNGTCSSTCEQEGYETIVVHGKNHCVLICDTT